MSRVGILGGSFDPIHVGHLVVADEVRDRAGLERILIVPAARSPHKPTEPRASADQRRRMVEAAVDDQPDFSVSTIEIDRGGVSYTIDTVTALIGQFPDDEFHFIAGADALVDLPDWHRIGDLLRLVTFHVAARPGHPLDAAKALASTLGTEAAEHIRANIVEIPLLDISSTEIRARVRTGRTIRYLVPPGVRKIIRAERLYGAPRD